jgi:N-formylglutamate amidohydrolase
MTTKPWTITEGDGPLVAVSVHSGHGAREDVAPLFALTDAERLREEDPFTDLWTQIAPTRATVQHSRFEVDLNRPRDRAVYLTPEQAWGLHVWKQELPTEVLERSQAQHDAFYAEMSALLNRVAERNGRFVVYDLHTYNHRREGADGPEAPKAQNPDVNLGTGTMNRERWAPIVATFTEALRVTDQVKDDLDVRENVKFLGGQFSRWVHETYPESGCSLAIEFKKFFMDEWTGEPHPGQVDAIRDALAATIAPVLETLARMR